MTQTDGHTMPCKSCEVRKWYAKRLDLHFIGEDCPYICEPYEEWKKREAEHDDADESDP